MASSSRPQKLAKLQNFKASLPHHSQASLHAMVQEANKTGLPEVSSGKHQRQARRELLASCDGGALGPLIQSENAQDAQGKPVQVSFTNLLTYLVALFARGGSFHQLVKKQHQLHPSSPARPWQMILYLDELIPGNVLGRAERKSWAWYASFFEMGPHLSSTDAWLTLAIVRSNVMSTLEAGVSQVTAMLLKNIFCRPISHPQGGLLLKHHEGDIRLHFTLSSVLADGAAQKQVWGSKGDSGIKFCFLCANIRASGTTEENMHENTRKYDQLVLTTNGQVLESYAQLHARKAICTKANFELWEKATGWTYSPLALMLDDQLKAMKLLQPCSQFTHDYMHGVLQGTGPIALFHFLCAMDTELQVWQFLEGYFKHWTFPKQWKSQHVGTYFSKKKMVSHKNNQKFSCQASELLAIFPVVRHFVHAVCMPRGLCLPASQAFLAMAAVIDQVHDGNQAGVISRNTLLLAIETSIEGFHTAFPAIPLIKKWHWQLHLPDAHARFGKLPGCFANERKHKPIGAMATLLHNLKNFEKNLLEQVLAQEMCTLDTPDLFQDGVFLVNPIKASKKTLQTLSSMLGEAMPHALTSQQASVNHTACHKGDVVIYQAGSTLGIAEVQLHLLLNGVVTTLVQPWQVKEWFPNQQYALCTIDTDPGFVTTASILTAVICHKGHPEAKVLLPYPICIKLLA